MPDINTKIKLTGESEYRQALSNINAGMKVLNSEMKLTTAQFSENAKGADALRAKNDVLSRTISSQEEKLALMRDQLKKTAQAYGEGSEKTMKLQAAVNNAETELLGMKKTLQENETAIASAENKTSSFGDKLQGLTDKLGIRLPPAAQKTVDGLKSVDAKAAAAAGAAALLVTAIVKVEKQLISMTKESARAADELVTLSQQMGISAQQLQEYQYAAEFVDVSVETLQGSLVKLTANMDKSSDGNEKATEAFSKLGISITNTDGSLSKADDVFLDAIDALKTVQNQTERDALAMDLFGKSASDLNPLITQGSQALKDLAAEANATGYVLDDLSLRKLTAMDDALGKLDKTQEGFRKRMSAEFAPYVTEAVEKVTKTFRLLGNAVVDSGAAEAMGMILESATKIITPVDQLNNDKLPRLQSALDDIARVCALISDAMSLTVNALGFFGSVGTLQFGKAGQYLSNVTNALGFGSGNNYQKIVQQQAGRDYNAAAGGLYADSGFYKDGKYYASKDAYYWELYMASGDVDRWTFDGWKRALGYNAAGTMNWRGGWSWVGENGPELAYLPRGSQIKTASESRAVGTENWYITIDAKNVREFNDIVRLAQSARQRIRMEGVG